MAGPNTADDGAPIGVFYPAWHAGEVFQQPARAQLKGRISMQSSGSQNTCWNVIVENVRGTEKAIEKLKNCIPSGIKPHIGNLEVKRGKLSRTGLRHTVTFYVLGPDLHDREIHEWFLSAGLTSWSISAVERSAN